MIKLFEEYDYSPNVKFLNKIEDFFNRIVREEHYVSSTLANQVSIHDDKHGTTIFKIIMYYGDREGTRMSNKSNKRGRYINMFYGNLITVDNKYPVLFEFMYNILSEYLTEVDVDFSNEGTDVSFKNDLTEDLVKKINFSNEDYEELVDAKRFGL